MPLQRLEFAAVLQADDVVGEYGFANWHRRLCFFGRSGRRIADIVAECNYAQRRSFEIMTAPDSYLTERDQAPDTYAEFLFRTSGGLINEPASAQRVHGRLAA